MKRLVFFLALFYWLLFITPSLQATSFHLLHSTHLLNGKISYFPFQENAWGPEKTFPFQAISSSPLTGGLAYLECSIYGEAFVNRILGEIDALPLGEDFAIAGIHVETITVFTPASLNPSAPIIFYSHNDGHAPAWVTIKDLTDNLELFSALFINSGETPFFFSDWNPTHTYQMILDWEFEDSLLTASAELYADIIFVPEAPSLLVTNGMYFLLFWLKRKKGR